MSNQAGWAKAGNYGIAVIALVIIVGIGLFLAGVFKPVELSRSPDDAIQSTPRPATGNTAADETQDQTAASNAEAGDLTAANPEGSAADVEEPAEIATDAPEEPAVTAEGEDAERAEAALPPPPVIDVFRLETDGGMLVAGQAEPGWDVAILVDGAEILTVIPDAAGQFVEFLDLEYSDQPRVLSLLMRAPDGQSELASTGEIILAPTQKPTPITTAEAVQSEPDEPGASAQAGPSEDGAAGKTEANVDVQQEIGSQAVLLADETGVQVLQPPQSGDASPEVMSSVAIDAITYSDEGQVQLSGRGSGKGSVRVYLNNAPVMTTDISEDGNWRSDLPQVDTGVYTLRIDELDDAGRVTSRVETPFKREDEDVLAQAAADQASSKIRAVTVQPGSTLWAISREAYGEGILYVRVFEANSDRIRDPDLIYPGQVFAIPE